MLLKTLKENWDLLFSFSETSRYELSLKDCELLARSVEIYEDCFIYFSLSVRIIFKELQYPRQFNLNKVIRSLK